ncbi:MAG: Nramp family divalent metal transporter [Bacteroidetes bacterium]|nr:Nramp family divalent metal transporter [Bacteroidota bacterium]
MIDPYVRSEQTVKAPPRSFRTRLRFLGPGFILSASIVGSGELIATTRLGAEAGWVTLWVILVSCLVKVAVQLEFGRHTIFYGETTMKAFSRLPGPRIGRTHWSIWTWMLLMVVKLLQVGGIVGGTALVLHLVLPQVPLWVWCYATAFVVSLIIYRGHYKPIESISVIMIGLFTLLTLASVVAVQFTDYRFSAIDLASGFLFELPPEMVLIVIGAFGITGVGGDEIMGYNYWLLEKGYAAWTGPKEDTRAWAARANGWVRVMTLDALLSMVVYTIMTAAFYVLGVAILHQQGLLPEGMELVTTLSQMYTQSLGSWAGTMFLVGAFVVLFSTLFGALALWTRLFSDAFSQVGWLDYLNPVQRHRAIALVAWIVPILWATLFLLVRLPTLMVIIGGVAGTGILVIVVVAVIYFRCWRTPQELRPSKFYDVWLWVSILVVAGVALYSTIQVLQPH